MLATKAIRIKRGTIGGTMGQFCLRTGAVKKWVTTSADWMPDEAVELTKAIKEIPLDLLPIMDKDGYIWIGGE